MNEQIKLLAYQAWVNNDQLDTGGYTDLEKFAHLIVGECIDVAFQRGDNVDYLKEHFGVKE